MCPIETSAGFKDGLARVVNPENVVDDPAALEEYSRDYSFVRRGSPMLIVYPGSKEEVQGIVRLANETLTPLIPVSSGAPRFHGDTVPDHHQDRPSQPVRHAGTGGHLRGASPGAEETGTQAMLSPAAASFEIGGNKPVGEGTRYHTQVPV